MSDSLRSREPIILLTDAAASVNIRVEETREDEIDLSGRSLRYVPTREEIIKLSPVDLNNVTKLNLSKNSISELSIELVSLFPNLVELDCSNNDLKEVPAFICRLKKLKILNLKVNRLTSTSFPDSMDTLTSLRHLNLSGNRIDVIPEVLLRLTDLESLHLGANAITELPSEIGNFQNLQHLYLGGNKLEEITPEIGRLSRIQSLALCDNRLKSLPNEITNLVQLRSLQLHTNQLQTLPRGLLELENIISLSLRENPLVVRFVKEMKFQLPSLQELVGRVLRNNKVIYQYSQVLPPHLVSYLDSAKHCDNPNCTGFYFESNIQKVKFADFCGKYRVPFLHYICSEVCEADVSTNGSQSSPDTSEDETDHRLRKVLLG